MTDTDTATPHDPDAAAKLAEYFRPGGFPGFTIDNGRAWTSEQVRDILVHHREFLRQMISVSAAEVLAELADARQQLDGLKTERAHLGAFDVSATVVDGLGNLWLSCAGLPFRNFKQRSMRLDDLVANALTHAARCPGLKEQREAAVPTDTQEQPS